MTDQTSIAYSVNENIFIPDLTKPSKHILIDMINWANKSTATTHLQPETTYFTDPVKLDDYDMNTRIRFAKVLGFYIPQGSEDIYYNRLDINQIAKSMFFDYTVYVDYFKEPELVSDLLNDLFSVFPVYLDKEDIIDEKLNINFKEWLFKLDNLECMHGNDYIDAYTKYDFPKVTIKINEEKCVGYLNKLTVTLQPKPIHIKHAVKQNMLKTSFMPYQRHGLS